MPGRSGIPTFRGVPEGAGGPPRLATGRLPPPDGLEAPCARRAELLFLCRVIRTEGGLSAVCGYESLCRGLRVLPGRRRAASGGLAGLAGSLARREDSSRRL